MLPPAPGPEAAEPEAVAITRAAAVFSGDAVLARAVRVLAEAGGAGEALGAKCRGPAPRHASANPEGP
jgi:hypothetical protein